MKHENPVLNKYQATYNISFIVPHLTLIRRHKNIVRSRMEIRDEVAK